MKKLIVLGLICVLTTGIEVNAWPNIPICMTGKLETTLPEYKSAFLNAVDLAL